jgi:hypothetical protein
MIFLLKRRLIRGYFKLTTDQKLLANYQTELLNFSPAHKRTLNPWNLISRTISDKKHCGITFVLIILRISDAPLGQGNCPPCCQFNET